jgi:hypothetical protein
MHTVRDFEGIMKAKDMELPLTNDVAFRTGGACKP